MLVDRKEETDIFKKMLHKEINHYVMDICQPGGKGKSYLLRAFRRLCADNNIACGFIEFSSCQMIDPLTCMRELAEHLGEENFIDFCKLDNEFHQPQPAVQIGGGNSQTEVTLSGRYDNSELSTIAGRDNITVGDIKVIYGGMSVERKDFIERELTKSFKRILLNLTRLQPTVIIFDGYEHSTQATGKWIQTHILNPTRDHTYPKISIIISGRPEGNRPTFIPASDWSKTIIHLDAFGELSEDDIRQYFWNHRGIQINESDIIAYHKVCKKNPLILAQIADMLETS